MLVFIYSGYRVNVFAGLLILQYCNTYCNTFQYLIHAIYLEMWDLESFRQIKWLPGSLILVPF